jgi:3-phenylpropionate/cinnamic acid dioxygenase small subunit
MDIQQISDQLEITALLHRYARAVDTKDWTLWRSVFTADAHVDYSSSGCPAGGRDEVADWLSEAFTHLPMSQHYLTNIEITPSASDVATVRAMFYNPMQLPGMAEMSYCGGYYHHEVVRTPEGWRSRMLREENAWFVNHPAGAVSGS